MVNEEVEKASTNKNDIEIEEGELTDEEETPYEKALKEAKDLKKKDLNIWNDIARNYSVPYHHHIQYSENDIPEVDPYEDEEQNFYDQNMLVANGLTMEEINLIYDRRAMLAKTTNCVEPPRRHRICKYFREGFCRDGEKCFFSHSLESSNKKNRLCKFYENTNCNQSNSCNYWHGEFPCYKFHILKNCVKDKFCKYSHETLSPFAKEALEEYQKEKFGKSFNKTNSDDSNIKVDDINFDNLDIDVDFRVWIPKLQYSCSQILDIINKERKHETKVECVTKNVTHDPDDSFNIRSILDSMKEESLLLAKKKSSNWISATKNDFYKKEENSKKPSWVRFSKEQSRNGKRSYDNPESYRELSYERNYKKPRNSSSSYSSSLATLIKMFRYIFIPLFILLFISSFNDGISIVCESNGSKNCTMKMTFNETSLDKEFMDMLPSSQRMDIDNILRNTNLNWNEKRERVNNYINNNVPYETIKSYSTILGEQIENEIGKGFPNINKIFDNQFERWLKIDKEISDKLDSIDFDKNKDTKKYMRNEIYRGIGDNLDQKIRKSVYNHLNDVGIFSLGDRIRNSLFNRDYYVYNPYKRCMYFC
uniref:Zinc finger protein n=1 Tax=Parastrongyloides trichosuri TaxID=131310 RepID=A0A0N4ZF35_PARTI